MTDREQGIAQRTAAALRDPHFVTYDRFIMNHVTASEPTTALGLLLFRCELLPELASGLSASSKTALLQWQYSIEHDYIHRLMNTNATDCVFAMSGGGVPHSRRCTHEQLGHHSSIYFEYQLED